MVDADLDADDAAEARSLWASCLRMLSDLAHESPDPEVREFAWRHLQEGLVKLRRFLVTPGIPESARQDAIEALRGFLDS